MAELALYTRSRQLIDQPVPVQVAFGSVVQHMQPYREKLLMLH